MLLFRAERDIAFSINFLPIIFIKINLELNDKEKLLVAWLNEGESFERLIFQRCRILPNGIGLGGGSECKQTPSHTYIVSTDVCDCLRVCWIVCIHKSYVGPLYIHGSVSAEHKMHEACECVCVWDQRMRRFMFFVRSWFSKAVRLTQRIGHALRYVFSENLCLSTRHRWVGGGVVDCLLV